MSIRVTWKKRDGTTEDLTSKVSSLPLKKAKSISMAFLRWVKAGFPKRTREQIKACLNICHSCAFWKPAGNFGLGECTHPKCGCTRFKPQWATEDCPVNLWPKLSTTAKKQDNGVKANAN